MDKLDCVVIGGGVVGLAVARAMAQAGREVILIEKHPGIGMETSSRNSEVIHAGLYYPTHSLKATLCVTGREMLYAYCEERGLAHQQCGKFLVATAEAQAAKLQAIYTQAQTNGCKEVFLIDGAQAKEMEPALVCHSALVSPRTGIVDSHALMLSLQGDAENAGATMAFGSEVVGGRVTDDGIVLQVNSDDGEVEFEASLVINCGGLWSTHVARAIDGLPQERIPNAYFAKGNYFSLSGKAPFSRLIYPVPNESGLGVHITIDLGGQARFGPDVEWLDQVEGEPNYVVDPSRGDLFYNEIRRYWPKLQDGTLQPAYSGVRPKISSKHEAAADFIFENHSNPHYLGLYGIESPGLTSSLAIAEHVAQCVAQQTR